MTLKENLRNIEKRYETLLNQLEARKDQWPEGRIEVHRNNKNVQYFLAGTNPENGKIERRYLSDNEEALTKALAQASYDKKIIKIVDENLKKIQSLNKTFEEDELESVYKALDPARQVLVEPVEPIAEEELEKWMKLDYEKNGFEFGNDVILTNRNERVRSKTEKIMADAFDQRGIPYKYECPLGLRNGRFVYPDFTFFNPRNREEIYWEHFGMMDKVDYVKSALRKIMLYEQNGLYRGERLITTFEWSTQSLNKRWLDHLINKYLCFD